MGLMPLRGSDPDAVECQKQSPSLGELTGELQNPRNALELVGGGDCNVAAGE